MGLSRTVFEINDDFHRKPQIFPTPCILRPTEGVPGNWVSALEKFDDIFSRLDTIHQRDGRTDGLTDTGRQQRPRLRIASRGKKNYVIIIICHFNYKILTSHGILLSSSCDSLIFASVVARHVRLCRQEVERAGDKKSNVDFVNSTSLLVCIGHKEASNWMLLAVYSSAKIGP